jgi:hypothetical protein
MSEGGEKDKERRHKERRCKRKALEENKADHETGLQYSCAREG